MIAEWAELGMVLPVEHAPSALPVADVRVEQGRNQQGTLIQVEDDPKYHLTEDIEDLLVQPAKTLFRARARAAAAPPKRSYRQGRI